VLPQKINVLFFKKTSSQHAHHHRKQPERHLTGSAATIDLTLAEMVPT
jgi:D-alanyl-D-alanine dipeptidase